VPPKGNVPLPPSRPSFNSLPHQLGFKLEMLCLATAIFSALYSRSVFEKYAYIANQRE